MQVKKTTTAETQVKFSVIASENELQALKSHVLGHFKGKVKVPGFREGKIPVEILEKHVDPNALQTEFLEEAVEQMYVNAVTELKIRPVSRPEISIKKFVPFTQLEFEADVAVLGSISLPDYKKLKKNAPKTAVNDKDVDDVIESLRTRTAEKKDVDRAAKSGDQVWIDFAGTDSKGQPVSGADGKDYPLVLGSKTFIPGFEESLEGLKADDEKTFTLTFPKDYGLKTLANKKVTFKATVTKVQEVVLPTVDDAFAAQAGPFKTVAELRENIKQQLSYERQQQADQKFNNDLMREIATKTKLSVPPVLVDEQIEHMLRQLQQNLLYRGQTFPEFLKLEGKSEEQYRKEVLRPDAQERVKVSLVLSEIAEAEHIEVTPEELEARMQLLKTQYQDPEMQAELAKPEARRDVASRLVTEKTLQKLHDYIVKK